MKHLLKSHQHRNKVIICERQGHSSIIKKWPRSILNLSTLLSKAVETQLIISIAFIINIAYKILTQANNCREVYQNVAGEGWADYAL